MKRKLLLTLSWLGSTVGTALAATGGGGTVNLTPIDPLGQASFTDVANAVTTALVNIAIPIVGVMVLIGGIQLMTAGGSTERIASGRKTITYAVIGFAVVLFAKGVVIIIKQVLGVP
jgi:hypothetical protein